MIYSFDIFDTLITRITGTPTGVFAIMQQTLIHDSAYSSIPKPLREDFFHARIYSEKKAREFSQAEEVTIVEIYDTVSNLFGLNSEQKNILIDLEVQTELLVVTGVKENIEKVKTLIKKGENVILLSDMYLRKSDIIQLLDSVDPFLSKNCKIYISSELKKTKHNGTLFDHIIHQQNVKPSNITHTGDNIYSDIRVARIKKINAVHYTRTKNNDYEDYIVNQKPDDCALQLMVGTSKFARMRLKNDIEEVGCSLAGPWLCTFLMWILENAMHSGTKKLYFLSRDGELLLQLADQIIKLKPQYSDIKLRYLCVSRHSTVYPSIDKIDQRAIDYILQKHPYLNADMIAQRTYTQKDTLIDFFKKKYRIRIDVANMGNRLCSRIETILKTDAELQKIILKRKDEKKELLLKYFEQEGLFELDTIEIVDLGWLCTIQDAIYNVINQSKYKGKKIKGYYFGITNYSQDTNKYNKKIPFAFHPYYPEKIYNKLYYVIFLELFCLSNLDITVDYFLDGNKIKVNQLPSKTKQTEFIKYIRGGISTYTDAFIRIESIFDFDFSKALNWYMSIFLEPNKRLATCIGSAYYSADPFDDDLREFAPKYTFKNLFKRGNGKWSQGSLIRSNFLLRFIKSEMFMVRKIILEIVNYLKELSKRISWKFMPLL